MSIATARISVSAGLSACSNSSPASVGATLRVVRASSRTPISSSSPPDGVAQRGLRHVEVLGGSRKAPLFRDGMAQEDLNVVSAFLAAFGKISGERDKPAGRVRLVVSPLAASVLGPKVGGFARDYPDVVLDITTDESRVDLVAAGYDAGIHYGEFIERDMVAVRVSPDHRPAPLHQLPSRP